MEIDERLRIGLRREESAVEPRTDDALGAVLRRARRRRLTRWSAGGIVAACALAVAAVLVPRVLPGPDAVPAASPTTARELIGVYDVVVPDEAGSRGLGVVGRWTVTVRSSGTMELSAPTTYPHPTSGAAYVASPDRLTTNALLSHPGCQSGTSGTYEWRREGNTLRFEVVDDACLARASLFAGQPWVARP